MNSVILYLEVQRLDCTHCNTVCINMVFFANACLMKRLLFYFCAFSWLIAVDKSILFFLLNIGFLYVKAFVVMWSFGKMDNTCNSFPNSSCSLSFLAGTTREHLGLAMALKVPIFIVISKVDLCTRATVERTVRQLERVLKQPGCNKVPMVVGNTDDAVTAAQQFAQSPK